MPALLLDEQIAPQVARQATLTRPEVPVVSLREWRYGALIGRTDSEVLAAAAEEAWTLVTYDLKTIPPLLGEWAAEGRAHAGVIFVDTRTPAPNDYDALIRASHRCGDARHAWEGTDRVVYFKASG